MKHYEVTETIAADADRVWAVLKDVESYADRDSGVAKVEGRLATPSRGSRRSRAD